MSRLQVCIVYDASEYPTANNDIVKALGRRPDTGGVQYNEQRNCMVRRMDYVNLWKEEADEMVEKLKQLNLKELEYRIDLWGVG